MVTVVLNDGLNYVVLNNLVLNNLVVQSGVNMNDFEKEHPLMNEVTRTINELYIHKKHDKILQDLLKREGLIKKRLQMSDLKGGA